MENEIYELEKKRLDYVLDYVDSTLFSGSPTEENLRQYIIDERRRIWDNFNGGTDTVEWTQANQTLERDTEQYFRIQDKLNFLREMRSSPYFARIDFTEEGYDEAEPVYIGSLSLIDSRTYEVLICDWRADIASLYYDAAFGPAEYKCQQGVIKGDITLRRQIKIEDSELKYVVDNGINITDPVLMEELGKSSDAKLKTVVNTIQQEQNRVIRNLDADLLLVQGSAGSGKTSVALHRIAYLLYRLRDSLNSQDVIIFSPSEVFSAYIAEVLPQLGEENCIRSDFYHFFSPRDTSVHYADRSEQIEAILQSNDPFLREMIAVKGSKSFAEELSEYYLERQASFPVNEEISVFDQVLATAEDLNGWFFHDYAAYQPYLRAGKIISRLEDVADEKREDICYVFLDEATMHGVLALTEEEEAEQLVAMWSSMLDELRHRAEKALLLREEDVYLDFLKDRYPAFYEYSAALFADGIVPFEDMLCISFLKLRSGRTCAMRTVKHIVVDEAQEYPPIVYMMLNEIFPMARFTVLGDIAQQVDRKISAIKEIESFFPTKKSKVYCHLDKSYRSTHEINAFANRFRIGDQDVRVMDRHGNEPIIEAISDPVRQVKNAIETFRANGHKTNMILCRTQKECDELYLLLRREMEVIRMRSFDTFTPETTVILPVYLSKGLEADGVVVYGVSEEWNTPEDRNLMFVAATRALHELTVLTDGDPEKVLKL